jgi:hypothetical protein
MEIKIGDVVYLKTDKEQSPRIVTGIMQRPGGFLYYISNSTTETSHYSIEFTTEINELIKLFN